MLADNDYSAFCNYLETTSGITLGTHKAYLVESRLKRIMEEYRLNSLGELVNMLVEKKHLTLEKHVIDAMTTNETSWFRDVFPFEFLKEKFLKEIPMSHTKPVRIWSAACSYGHEPYSISMMVQEFLDRNPGRIPGGVEIIGTDISSQVLDQSAYGLYKSIDMQRGLSDERKEKHFMKKGNDYQISENIKRRVSFRKHNLVTNSFPMGMFDIIYCRNVLIYFSSENKEKILTSMVKSLAPTGYLFLGASEPMVNYSDRFNMETWGKAVVYHLNS